MSVENGMLQSSSLGIYEANDLRNQEVIVGYCDGCGQSINQNEDFYEDESGVTKIHDDPYCAKEYIAKRAIKHIGKEK